jgi:hypothetical protein
VGALIGTVCSLAALACSGPDAPSSSGTSTSSATGAGGTGASGVTGAGGAASGTGGVSSGGGAGDGVTWHQHVAPLVAENCSGCHVEGGIAPISFQTYAQAAPWAELMVQATERGDMPPWGAFETEECAPRFAWKDDLRLTSDEKALLRAWFEAGAPEGDPATAAALPPATALELSDRNLRLTIPTSVEVSGTEDRFLCFSLDPALASDVWVNGVQVNPGNEAIVHHVLLFADPDGSSAADAAENGYYDCFGGPGGGSDVSLIGAWAPGAVPAVTPGNVALGLSAGSRLIMNVHYHPTGAGVEADASTSVDLRWSATAPDYVGALLLIGNFENPDSAIAGGAGFGLLPGTNDPPEGPSFVIPAGATAHSEMMRFAVPTPDDPSIDLAFYIWGAGTHMHYVGRDMLLTLEHTDGSNECLVQTPDWDFNWQRLYYYDAPVPNVPVARGGDVLTMRCTYDNSLSNPFVRSALDEQGLTEPVPVELGEATLDEMCLGVFGVAVDRALAEALE